MSPAGSAPLFRVLGLLERVKKSGSGYTARCPGARHEHGDRHPSLSIGLGYDGRVLLNCNAGCETGSILSALKLDWTDLFEKSQAGNPVRRFRLVNGTGSVVAEHVREDLPGDKKLWWESHGRKGLNGTRTEELPLYRLPEVLADTSRPVIVTEGEKAADALADLGLLVVATVTGADGTPNTDALAALQGREVWLWPDNDTLGQEHMRKLSTRISPAPKWIVWSAAPPKGDAADYVAGGGTAEGVRGMLLTPLPAPAPPRSGPRIWTGPELAAMAFDAPRWAIPDLLPAGLSILAGRPKLGKSWLGLGWALDIARPSPALRRLKVVQGETLYLALEDGPRRMQERMALMLGDTSPPQGFHVVTEWPRTNEGGLDLLSEWLTVHPNARMVVIDTFKRVRPVEKNSQRLYDLDYDAMQPLAELARRHNVAIVVVFHTRKGESTDPLEMVSGTLGLSGAADAVLVLRRERGQADASLFVTGRDVEEQDLALRWEKDDLLGWTLLGEAEQFRRSKERQLVLDAVSSVPGMSPAEVADAVGKTRGSVRYLLFNMTKDGDLRTRDGRYYPTPNSPNSPTGSVLGLLSTTPNSPNSPNSIVNPSHIRASGLLGAPAPTPNSPNSSLASDSTTVRAVSAVRGVSPVRAVSGGAGGISPGLCQRCRGLLAPAERQLGVHLMCTIPPFPEQGPAA